MQAATGTGKYERLLARCEGLAPVPTAVAHPCEATALGGAVEAAQKGLIAPLLVGPADKIAEVAKSDEFGRKNALLLRNTNPVNFFDLCAISLPMQLQHGLATGLMLVGRNGQDRRLFNIAAAVEKCLQG